MQILEIADRDLAQQPPARELDVVVLAPRRLIKPFVVDCSAWHGGILVL
jgi:hypothetical protein